MRDAAYDIWCAYERSMSDKLERARVRELLLSRWPELMPTLKWLSEWVKKPENQAEFRKAAFATKVERLTRGALRFDENSLVEDPYHGTLVFLKH